MGNAVRWSTCDFRSLCGGERGRVRASRGNAAHGRRVRAASRADRAGRARETLMAVTMLHRSYGLSPPLCEFVSDFWLYENYDGKHRRELILPSGTFELVFNLQEDELRIYSPTEPTQCRRFSGALISGPYSGSFMSDA